MPLADAQSLAQLLAARGEDDLWLTPVVLHHSDVAQPHAMGEAGAHRLDHRLLAREAHRQIPCRPLRALELRALLLHQQSRDEVLSEALVGLGHALRLEHVDADAEDHGPRPARTASAAAAKRAACISARISRTA